MTTIAITASEEKFQKQAEKLAAELSLSLCDRDNASSDYVLSLGASGLQIHKPSESQQKSFVIDFQQSSLQYRQQRADHELLAKALGKQRREATVIDATAGCGRDASIIAHCVKKLIMLERSPIIAAMLKDALARADLPHVSFIQIDAKDYLQANPKQADIIYLDPMFPPRTKTALVKKELRILRDIVVADDGDQNLLEIALAAALKRVVVKRPRTASCLSNIEPSFSHSAKACRFDVYCI